MNNDELLKENISIALKKIGNYIYEWAFPFISSFKYIKKLGDDEVYEDENSTIIKGFCHFISQQVLCGIALFNMYPGVLKNIILFRLGGYLLFKFLGSVTGYGVMRLKYYLEDNKILKKENSDESELSLYKSKDIIKEKKLSKSNERNYQTEIERLKSLKEELINNNVDINLNEKPKTRIR